jgi:hypothetical protein
MFSVQGMILKDIGTFKELAIHLQTDNALTCTDDLTCLTSARKQSRRNTLQLMGQDFSV